MFYRGVLFILTEGKMKMTLLITIKDKVELSLVFSCDARIQESIQTLTTAARAL